MTELYETNAMPIKGPDAAECCCFCPDGWANGRIYVRDSRRVWLPACGACALRMAKAS